MSNRDGLKGQMAELKVLGEKSKRVRIVSEPFPIIHDYYSAYIVVQVGRKLQSVDVDSLTLDLKT